MGYKFVEHTADIAVRIDAQSAEELFLLAAEAFKEISIDSNNYNNITSKKILLNSNSFENLLIEFLNELNYFQSAKKLVYNDCKLLALNKSKDFVTLNSVLNFINLTDDMQLKQEIKAVTYHNLKIKKTKNGITTTIIFDI